MGAETELERLVVRLVGDDSGYTRVIKKAIADTERAGETLEKASKRAAAQVNSVLKEAARVTQAAATPLERYGTELARVNSLYDQGVISGTTYNRTVVSLNREFAQGYSKIDAYGQKIAGVGRGMRNFGAVATLGVTMPIMGLGAWLIKTASDAEMMGIKFETMLGRDQGRAMLANIRQFADLTPFRFDEVAASAKTLISFGMEEEKVMGTLKMLGDVAAGTGKDFNELSVIFGQIRGMGRLQGQDFLQLVNAGFPVAEIAKTIGTNMKGLQERMKEGDVPFSAVLETFRRLTSEGGVFNNMMEKLSATTGGRFSTLLDKFQGLARTLGEQLLPAANIFITWATEAISVVGALSPKLLAVAMGAAAIAAVFGPLLTTAGMLTMALGSMVSVYAALAGMEAGTVTSTLALVKSFGGVAAAVAGVVAAIMLVVAAVYTMRAVWEQNTSGIRDKIEAVGKTINDVFSAAWAPVRSFLVNLLEGAQNVGSKVMGFFKDVGNAIIQSLAGAGAFWSTLTSTWSVDEATAASMDAAAKDYMGALGESLASAGATVTESVVQWGRDMGAGAEIAMDYLGKKLDPTAVMNAVKQQLKDDFGGVDKVIQEAMPNIPGFGGGDGGAGGGGDEGDGGGGKGGDKAAKELEALQKAGASAYESLAKMEGIISSVTEKMAALEAAGKADTGTLALLGRSLWSEVQDWGQGAIDTLIGRLDALGTKGGTVAAGLGAAMQEAASKAATELLDKYQGPDVQAARQVAEDVATLKRAGGIGDDEANVLAGAYFRQWGTDAKKTLDAVRWQLESLGQYDVIAKMRVLLDGKDDAGKALAASIDAAIPAVNIVDKMDVESAKTAIAELGNNIATAQNAGRVPTGEANMLADRYWQQFSGLSKTAFDAVVAELGKMGTAGADVAKRMRQNETVAQMTNLSGVIGRVGSAVSGLGGKWAGVAKACQVAQGLMSAAAAAVQGDWVGALLAIVETLGIFGGKAEKELEGVAKVIDEIKQASDQWVDQITEAFLEFTKKGTASWKELFQTIMDDVYKIAMSELVVQPMMNWFGGVLGMANGGVISGGKVIAMAGGGYITRGPEIVPMADGNISLRGEAGEEAVLPLKRTGGRLGVDATGAGGGVVVNIHDHRTNGEQIHVTESNVDGQRQLDIVVRDSVSRLVNSGGLDRAYIRRFGLATGG